MLNRIEKTLPGMKAGWIFQMELSSLLQADTQRSAKKFVRHRCPAMWSNLSVSAPSSSTAQNPEALRFGLSLD
jgi:hypothetical protein